jgi:hypothetical protein
MSFIHGALTGAAVWVCLALIFGAWWAITGYRLKTRRRRNRCR